MTATTALNSTTAANATTWADDVDDTVNGLSSQVLGRLSNVAGTNSVSGRLALSTGFTAISNGSQFSFVALNTNTGAVTMQLQTSAGANVGSSFALRDAKGTALAAGALVAGQLYRFEYNSTDTYARMLAPIALRSGVPDALVYDKKTSGTAGGATTSGSWLSRAVNTEYDPNSVISISAGDFIPVYDGWVKWSSVFFDGQDAQTRLYNVTDAVAVDPPSLNVGQSGASDGALVSVGSAPVTAGKTYRIQYRVSTSIATNGLGKAFSWGDEIFTIVEYYAKPL